MFLLIFIFLYSHETYSVYRCCQGREPFPTYAGFRFQIFFQIPRGEKILTDIWKPNWRRTWAAVPTAFFICLSFFCFVLKPSELEKHFPFSKTQAITLLWRRHILKGWHLKFYLRNGEKKSQKNKETVILSIFFNMFYLCQERVRAE